MEKNPDSLIGFSTGSAATGHARRKLTRCNADGAVGIHKTVHFELTAMTTGIYCRVFHSVVDSDLSDSCYRPHKMMETLRILFICASLFGIKLYTIRGIDVKLHKKMFE